MQVVNRPVVCQIVHTLNVGGAELLAQDFARCAAGEFQTVFACLDELGTMGEELRREGYPVTVVGRRNGFDYRAARLLARFCRAQAVSVIHAHQYAPFFYSALARAPRRRPPIIFTEHGRAFPDYPRPKRIWANRLLLGRGDRVVAVGEDVRRALIENEGIRPERVETVYNGIDLEQPCGDEERKAMRRELGLAENDICVTQVARLNELKDHATAVRMMKRLGNMDLRVQLFLVGDGELREPIEQMIRDAGLQGTIRMLGLRDDVKRLLPAADMFLLTSISEGIPLTLIEAMAAGLPCVSTDVGGVSEVVVDGETGLLAPAQDDEGLARHVSRLAGDSGLRQKMGQQGCSRAHEKFSAQQMHRTYQEIYAELAGLNGG